MKVELNMSDEFKSELEKLLKEVVKGEIIAFGFSEPKKEKKNEYWSRKETAKFIGCSMTTLYHYQCKGILPFAKLGNKVLFNKAEVLKALEGGKL
ncbi:helix-turn-helix domain-containing protein [Mangrovibacterium marinum]|uniref:Excisionase family DNA binding protein n=1 Tax=Mangrovibacterium marinum TaxID=1639118 RepID=A0A2T5BYT0_9BACT|nr:helix-turn-helix domain-containing protein [Mangrovibacterium marinum]PTN07412.1 excisionase family DNA binding protein [Mangrovibacterium marinum]